MVVVVVVEVVLEILDEEGEDIVNRYQRPTLIPLLNILPSIFQLLPPTCILSFLFQMLKFTPQIKYLVFS